MHQLYGNYLYVYNHSQHAMVTLWQWIVTNRYHRLIRDKHADLLFTDNWENCIIIIIIIIMKTKYEITGINFTW